MARRRLHKRYGKRQRRDRSSEPRRFRSNPTPLGELAEFVGPGFASFAATRLLTRIAAVQIAKWKPGWAKHAGALASVGSLGLAWWGAHRVKMLEKYHTPIVVGSAIAAIQSIIQIYIPKLGWMIADASPDMAADLSITDSNTQQSVPKLTPVDDDPTWYTFDDKFDAGRYTDPKQAAGGPSSSAQSKVAKEDQILQDLQLDDASNLGIFN